MTKYSCDENYFENLTHNSAYIAGFIMADGCILERSSLTLEITLHPKDIEILEFIKKELQFDGPIVYRKIHRNDSRIQESVRLRITSNKLCLDLKHIYNIIPRKTRKECLPNLSKEYLYSFIAGVFDGDGCCYISKKDIFCISIACGNELFLDNIKTTFNNLGIVSPHNGIWYWKIYGSHAFYVRDILYKNLSFSLSRKKEKMYSMNRSNLMDCLFTPDEDNRIKELISTDLSLIEIGELLNRNPNMIANRAVNLGVYIKNPRKKLSKIDKQYIIDNFDPNNPGDSYKDIADKISRSVSSIKHCTHRMGLCNPKRKYE